MTIRTNATGAGFIVTERRAKDQYGIFLEELEEIVDRAMKNGANRMREIILTEGVHNTVPNGEGRVDSHEMLDDVTSKTRRNSRGRIEGSAGWLPGTGRQKYYGWQESGTFAKGLPSGDPDTRAKPRSPRGIKPMMAMSRANDEMTVEIEAQMRRYQ